MNAREAAPGPPLFCYAPGGATLEAFPLPRRLEYEARPALDLQPLERSPDLLLAVGV